MKTHSIETKTGTRRGWARVLGAALAVCALLATAPASAGDVDTVFLTNGGRVRGTVMVDDAAGVSVKLGDGTVRKLTRGEVTRVEYASDAPAPAPPPAPAPAPAPAAAPAPVMAQAAPPAAMAAQPSPFAFGGEEGDSAAYKRRSAGLMVTGIVLMPIGAVALGSGIALAVAAGEADTDCDSYGYCYGSEDDDMMAAAAATAVVGGVLLTTGVIFTIVGAPKVRRSTSVGVGPRGITVSGQF